MENIGDRLKYFRTQILGISQSELGETLGLTKAAISLLEKNQRELSLKYIKTLCAKYGINETWLRIGIGNIYNTGEETKHTNDCDYVIEDSKSEALYTYIEAFNNLKKNYNITDIDIFYFKKYINCERNIRDQIIDYIKSLTQ